MPSDCVLDGLTEARVGVRGQRVFNDPSGREDRAFS